MRVISQDGKFDFPYEQIAVYRNENIVLCRFSNVERSSNTLGVYSTEDKVEKAMQMLRNKYMEPTYQNDVGGNESAIYDAKVFQFPQDSEVEV